MCVCVCVCVLYFLDRILRSCSVLKARVCAVCMCVYVCVYICVSVSVCVCVCVCVCGAVRFHDRGCDGFVWMDADIANLL